MLTKKCAITKPKYKICNHKTYLKFKCITLELYLLLVLKLYAYISMYVQAFIHYHQSKPASKCKYNRSKMSLMHSHNQFNNTM